MPNTNNPGNSQVPGPDPTQQAQGWQAGGAAQGPGANSQASAPHGTPQAPGTGPQGYGSEDEPQVPAWVSGSNGQSPSYRGPAQTNAPVSAQPGTVGVPYQGTNSQDQTDQGPRVEFSEPTSVNTPTSEPKEDPDDQKKKKKKKKKREYVGYIPMVCHILGIVLVVAVFIMTLPLVVPQFFGYQAYDVVSGSMTPTIPVNSLIYVKPVDPEDVQEDEIISFYQEGTVVTHRVVTNRRGEGTFITRGDANNAEDPDPIPYNSFIGLVVQHVPYLGRAMALYASNVGKVYLMLTLACGVLLNVMGEVLRRRRSRVMRNEIERQLAEQGIHDPNQIRAAQEAVRESRAVHWVRSILTALLLIIFLGSLGIIIFVNWQFGISDQVYEAAQESNVNVNGDQVSVKSGLIPPITIDFTGLLKQNPDIQGWIYCEDTDINYPVLRGETNDTYLRHDYLGDYNVNGSIFVDSGNSPGFTDANTIIYGHHMSTGTMFAVLDYWQTQKYYEEHPYMWLLTPTQDYQIVLISAHHVSAYSDFYQIYSAHDDKFARFLQEATLDSDFQPFPEATVNPDRNYVMLSTCAYIFEGSRYVIHGKLVPVNSAGGKMLGPEASGAVYEANGDRLTPMMVQNNLKNSATNSESGSNGSNGS